MLFGLQRKASFEGQLSFENYPEERWAMAAVHLVPPPHIHTHQ